MATFVRSTTPKLVLTCHESAAVVQPACKYAWRIAAKRFSDNGCAPAANAALNFSCVRVVIADNATAASAAVRKRGFSNTAAPIAAISKVRKQSSTIVTGSGCIGNAVGETVTKTV